ncbi:hypothetical protein [Dyadobacter sp. CY326]|uniref:hypothetical protein n=1 Tax=Dyadobacter sp. CY326 TaxID=2907300 RepID=UPI001F1E3792|nr:hypothetical protein [Dyadobacter sp. CY326]MCE7063895.1 hypothetical protein [Dyadobacter sp. CY326]
MKKSVIFAFAILCGIATASYAQVPAASSTKDQSVTAGKQAQGSQAGGKKNPNGTAQSGNSGQLDTRSQQAQKSAVDDGSTRPGGASKKNANDVGRYSDADNEKSMLNSKKALAARKKNMTEPDTTVKKGSGSAARNTKNRTGKTGNYENQENKHNQKTQLRK